MYTAIILASAALLLISFLGLRVHSCHQEWESFVIMALGLCGLVIYVTVLVAASTGA